MPTATLTPTKSTQERLPRNRILGLFDYDIERNESNERLKTTPSFDMKGSLPFNTAVYAEKIINTARNTVVDTFEEAFDLGKYIFTGDSEAIGITAIETPQSITTNAETAKTQTKEESTDSPLIQEIISWLNALKQAQSIEVYKTKTNEAMRLTDGPISEDEAQGYQDKDAIATLVGIANKRVEVRNQQIAGTAEASVGKTTGGTAGTFTMGENEMLKGGENDQHFTKTVG